MHVVSAPDLTDALFGSALSLVQREESAIDPGVAPVTAEEFRRLIADDRSEGNRHLRFAAVDGDTVRAVAHLELDTDPANLHFASVEIFGAGRDPAAGNGLIRHVLDVAEADGRTTLLGWGPDEFDEGSFWTALGAEIQYTERISALDVTAVDPGLMQAWIDGREERAADVRLVRWIGACPDEYLPAFAASRTAMNDAPREGIAVNDVTFGPDDIRAADDACRVLGLRQLTVFAIDPDGGPVGHTQIQVNPFRPDASWQWDTAVLDAHRRRGIGRWLKAEMWQWLRAEEPKVERIRTGNAESNAAMLAINVAMGFTEAVVYGAWQADLATYRAHLD